MKKNVLKTLMALAMVAAFAGNASADTQAAVVIKEGSCGMYDGNGGFVVTSDVQTTATQSANGNAMLRCKAKVDSPLDGKAVVYSGNKNGGGCSIASPFGWYFTNEYHETVSANGEAVLTCHYNANQQ